MLASGLMIKGAYKNDLKTRLFFKVLIGEYFHFTSFGIDWLNELWMEGRPPTYQEFSSMWKLEYQRRKENPVDPKAEWAYINYVQSFIKQFPDATQKDINHAWENERERHKTRVTKFMNERSL